MKFTEYFKATKERSDRKGIKQEWIEFVYLYPVKEVVQQDGRIKRWAFIEEAGKFLRIVVLEDKETIHNAFFDRQFKI